MSVLLAMSVLAAVHVSVDPTVVRSEVPRTIYGTGMEDVNHEIYGGLDAQRLFGESFEEGLPVGKDVLQDHGVSGCWMKALAVDGGDFIWSTNVFHWGCASQGLAPNGGKAAIANAGLRNWGVPCRAGKLMRGYAWVRGSVGTLEVALQDAFGERTYARATLKTVADETWHRISFELIPDATDAHGRFLICASGLGTVWVDDVYLADAPTDQFGELGCREDIVGGFRTAGVTFLRWGGSMVNAKEYRLANMPGTGERKAYEGFWNRKSSGGFGVREFVRMAAAMGLPCAVAINAYEKESDAGAFAKELLAYDIPIYVQIGNEELTGCADPEDKCDPETCVRYCASAKRLVAAMRAVNPKFRFVSAVMWNERRMDLMEKTFRELDGVVDYWDLHPYFTDPAGARKARDLVGRVLKKMRTWNPKTTMRVAVFEENGNNHGLDRALGHAIMLEAVREAGADILTSCPANALQPYLNNDNWWDQGSIFFTPTRVWLQPCGYAQKMASEFHRNLLVEGKTDDAEVSVSATRNRDGKSVVLHLVNSSWEEKEVAIAGTDLPIANVVSLSGPSSTADNPPDDPTRVSPRNVTTEFLERHAVKPYSYTIVELSAR